VAYGWFATWCWQLQLLVFLLLLLLLLPIICLASLSFHTCNVDQHVKAAHFSATVAFWTKHHITGNRRQAFGPAATYMCTFHAGKEQYNFTYSRVRSAHIMPPSRPKNTAADSTLPPFFSTHLRC
jgi:hypothetical protein